jgi:hypothetical protein
VDLLEDSLSKLERIVEDSLKLAGSTANATTTTTTIR